MAATFISHAEKSQALHRDSFTFISLGEKAFAISIQTEAVESTSREWKHGMPDL